MRVTYILAILIFKVSLLQATVSFAQKPLKGFTYSADACSKEEQWTFSRAIPEIYRAKFRNYLAGEIPPIVAMAEGHGLQESGGNDESRLFGAYWKYRVLHQMGSWHLAANGMNWVASRSPNNQVVGIQTAALECLNRIHAKYTRISPRAEVAGNLPLMNELFDQTGWYGRNQNTLWEAATHTLHAQVAEKKPEVEIQQTLKVLANGGPYFFLNQGVWLGRTENFKEAALSLEKFLNTNPMPPALKRYQTAAAVLLARSYYKIEEYSKASAVFKKVDKSSNEIVRVLAEKAWVDLMANNYPEAVGTALNLQSGALRNTFAPESFMLLAMAYNELCQYPPALNAIRYFHNNYKSIYEWLKNWYVQRDKNPINFYQEVVNYLTTEKSRIPLKVMSEWLRSPIFISHQEELNLMVDEKQNLSKIFVEMRKENLELSKKVRELRSEVQGEMRKAGGRLPPGAKDVGREYKDSANTLKAMESMRLWLGNIVKTFARRQNRLEKVLRARVNSDLKARNVRMLGKLKELGETAYLIQIEIYNGASEDIVWKNTHPDFKKFSDEIKRQAASQDVDKVWNWGPAPSLKDGSREIWADELGTLKASLNNNCENREKFLEVKVLDSPRIKNEGASLEVKGKDGAKSVSPPSGESE